MKVTIIEPKRLDTIVFEHYGNLNNLEDVMIKNPQYLDKYILATGDKVELPIYEEIKENDGVSLWD